MQQNKAAWGGGALLSSKHKHLLNGIHRLVLDNLFEFSNTVLLINI